MGGILGGVPYRGYTYEGFCRVWCRECCEPLHRQFTPLFLLYAIECEVIRCRQCGYVNTLADLRATAGPPKPRSS